VFTQDPFGFGDAPALPVGADPNAVPPARVAQEVYKANVQRGGMDPAWETAKRVYGGWPGLPPALRFPENSVPVWPPRAIVPDPRLFPNLTWRLRTITIEAPEDPGATQFQTQIMFSDYLSVMAISGGARVQDDQGANIYGQAAMERIRIQFTRDTGDQLSTGGLAFMSGMVGDGRDPMPLGTPGWAFSQNQSLVLTGETETAIGWIISLVFHCCESVPKTNLGMSRTPGYTTDYGR